MSIKSEARWLAQDNYEANPHIETIYWFPNDEEIHLLHLEECQYVDECDIVMPFYMEPNCQIVPEITHSYGIAIIKPKEFGKVLLPEGWTSWNKAVLIERK